MSSADSKGDVMAVIAFDTLAYARKLEEAGFTRRQAEIQALSLIHI